ncbi:peroxisomal targeting signal 1 receptor [Musca vetustissima]|uniref:peroxisomal targeting signal 1 receptor n=1 Tax=Musca vetustissima TaxID=27455 RepID=UPI002AB6CC34|nr:peroxisomal targeting signal 1 receptor [Musca vetustissima]
MALRQLVEGDCGGVNPLMQLGGEFTRDVARKDEGFSQGIFERNMRPDEQMVNEFLGQVSAPPQSFQMDTLLQEMRQIEQASCQPQAAPRVIDEVVGQWSKDFRNEFANQVPTQQLQPTGHVRDFFEESPSTSTSYLNRPVPYVPMYAPLTSDGQQAQTGLTDKFFEEAQALETLELPASLQGEDWVNDYKASNESNEQAAANYNEKFWQRLQDEWAKISEESDHPWLSEFDESYDPYKEYKFAEENPMKDIHNPLEKGKEYLAKGDIPSAVLCFEVAVSKDPENADAWEYLGISQAENEMDPQGIAALKKSLDLKPDNAKVLMALAVCYTNESLQSQAVKMLTTWLQNNPKYKHLVAPSHAESTADNAAALASSLIRGNRLQEVQDMFLEAVRMNPQDVDPEVQEALGVLYNLSAEYDKAVDCFKAALQVDPQNAKIWNRLGASLANGSRSVEAVEAYQRALELEPGFIRVRYNVGVCCLNLKAYKQACEHLLTALNMQANVAATREFAQGALGSSQQMSESIWSTLKMVVSLMGRNDLQGHVSDRNLAALNEAFKD